MGCNCGAKGKGRTLYKVIDAGGSVLYQTSVKAAAESYQRRKPGSEIKVEGPKDI